jgi:hypothetical protein
MAVQLVDYGTRAAENQCARLEKTAIAVNPEGHISALDQHNLKAAATGLLYKHFITII